MCGVREQERRSLNKKWSRIFSCHPKKMSIWASVAPVSSLYWRAAVSAPRLSECEVHFGARPYAVSRSGSGSDLSAPASSAAATSSSLVGSKAVPVLMGIGVSFGHCPPVVDRSKGPGVFDASNP